MKKTAFNLFAPSCPALVLSIASSLLLSITLAKGQDINEFTTGNNLGTGSNWSLNSAPTGNANAGSHKDILLKSETHTTLNHSGTFIYARSHNVTNGSSYTIFSNRAPTDPATLTTFRIGSTGSTAPLPTTFTNSYSNVENDLIYLSNNSNLTYDGVNPVEGGPAPVVNLPLATGNFNISAGSTLTINPVITGSTAITLNGGGTTIFNGANTHSGSLTVNGGSLEIAGSHGSGGLTLNNGSVLISGARSGGGTNIRNGTLEITGTSGGVSYTIANTDANFANFPEGTAPELKLGNLGATIATATITGSDSIARAGSVNLAVAGSYTMGSYVRGNITFTNSSGSPATLTFTNNSAVSSGTNATRNFDNASSDLSIVFSGTLDIGSSANTHVNVNTTGTTTVAGGITSTGDGVRDLRKGGGGTLAVNGPSSYQGETRLSGGVLLLGHANAIPGGIEDTGGTSNLHFNSTTAVVGLTPASGDFLRTLGDGPDQVSANPTQDGTLTRRLGFAAFGGDRIVDFGASIMLSTTSHAGRGLTLGHATADSKVTLVNNINLANASRTFLVNDGSAEVDAEISGVISSPGATLQKTGAGTLALTGENTYASDGGGTDVLDGVLRVNGTSLADTSKLVINGGVVHVTGTEIVGSLFFGEDEQDPGTWGATGSGADNIDDTRFAGTGVVQVGAGSSSPYEEWADGESFGDDANGDGISNGLAFLLGADNPQANALNLLPAATHSTGALVLTFQMRADRGDATLKLQHSSDLGIGDPWATVTVPDSTPDPQASDVSFTITPGTPLNSVTATIASSQANNGKLFARLQATE